MTVLGDLPPDKQRLLLSSLEASAIFVSAASPGRAEETASEGFAVAQTVLDSMRTHLSNPLISSTIVALQERIERGDRFPDYVELASRPDARERAQAALRAVTALLAVKATPEEGLEFRRWLVTIAEAAAGAGKEDQGFLGRGGVLVNDAERGALAEVAALLGVEPVR